MVNMSKRQQPGHQDNMSAKGHPMVFNEQQETLTPQGRLQLAPKHHYTQIQRKSCPYLLK